MKKSHVSGLDIELCHGCPEIKLSFTNKPGKNGAQRQNYTSLHVWCCICIYFNKCAEYGYVNSESAMKHLFKKHRVSNTCWIRNLSLKLNLMSCISTTTLLVFFSPIFQCHYAWVFFSCRHPAVLLLPSALVRGFEWGIYSRNVCMYVSVTFRNVNLHTSRNSYVMSRNSYITCTDTGEYRMPSLAASDGGQGRTVLLDNGGRVGQCSWSSATYAFCGVEYWTQPMVCGIEKEKSRYSRN